MAIVITIANGKGGVGKSTVAINLAGGLSAKSASVFLVDADPQGTVSDWFKSRKSQTEKASFHKNIVVTSSPWSIHELASRISMESQRHHYTIIDCGPANDRSTRTAISVSHFIIIPVTPSPYDIHSVRRTIEMIKEGQSSAGIRVIPHLLISKKIVGTSLGEEAKKALSVFETPLFKTEICQRIALCEAGIVGQTIDEYAPQSRAAREFEDLAKEVMKWQKQSSHPSPNNGSQENQRGKTQQKEAAPI